MFYFKHVPNRDPNYYGKNNSKLNDVDMGQLYAIAQCFAVHTDTRNSPVVLVMIPVISASVDVASVVEKYFCDPSLTCEEWLQKRLYIADMS